MLLVNVMSPCFIKAAATCFDLVVCDKLLSSRFLDDASSNLHDNALEELVRDGEVYQHS
jgi:hypothetical protein